MDTPETIPTEDTPNVIAPTDALAVHQRVKVLLADPQHAGKTDQQSADILNTPIPELGPDGKPTGNLLPPPYVATIIGVPYAPNAISAADVAAAKGV